MALGNAPRSAEVIAALKSRVHHPDEIVREHVALALQQQEAEINSIRPN